VVKRGQAIKEGGRLKKSVTFKSIVDPENETVCQGVFLGKMRHGTGGKDKKKHTLI